MLDTHGKVSKEDYRHIRNARQRELSLKSQRRSPERLTLTRTNNNHVTSAVHAARTHNPDPKSQTYNPNP